MAMGVNAQIIQVVGYQNSGKTVLIEKIVGFLTNKGLKVGTIKHHGHGGMPEQMEDKDSARHYKAGAEIATVEGEGLLQMLFKEKRDLQGILQVYKDFHLDVILIEGYKKATYSKLVMIRNEEDIVLLDTVAEVVAVITWIPLELDHKSSFPVFLISEEEAILTWIDLRLRKSQFLSKNV